MNIPTIIALIIILALVIPAVRYIHKNGTCAGCPDKGACSGHCTMDKKECDYCKEKEDKIEEIIRAMYDEKHRL